MPERETIFSSDVKYGGVFSFKDFYQFCHEWLTEEIGLYVEEGTYQEKISGDSKSIEVEWKGSKKLSDYFKFETRISFVVGGLTNVEAVQEGIKIKTNRGSIKVSVKGDLVRDYQGKFEGTAFKKFMRSIYEKWVIPSVVEQMEGKVVGACDRFLGQAKAYLDLEGKK
jgi:hypothetical protein